LRIMILSQDHDPIEAVAADTVFVLDADPGFRRALAELLSHAGLRLVLFGRVSELLTALRALRPSLIVADLLPEMPGERLLGALRRDDDWRSIPVVIMTDENDTALPLRVDAPVVYKLDIDGVVATIRSVLRAVDPAIANYPATA